MWFYHHSPLFHSTHSNTFILSLSLSHLPLSQSCHLLTNPNLINLISSPNKYGVLNHNRLLIPSDRNNFHPLRCWSPPPRHRSTKAYLHWCAVPNWLSPCSCHCRRSGRRPQWFRTWLSAASPASAHGRLVRPPVAAGHHRLPSLEPPPVGAGEEIITRDHHHHHQNGQEQKYWVSIKWPCPDCYKRRGCNKLQDEWLRSDRGEAGKRQESDEWINKDYTVPMKRWWSCVKMCTEIGLLRPQTHRRQR